jgi:threonine/homoserine/homoserine lactone efflux protein
LALQKRQMRILIELLLFPLLATLFFLDRVVLLLCWWMRSTKFSKWIFNETEMLRSLKRVIIVLLIILAYKFILTL